MSRIYFAIVNRGKANALVKYTKMLGHHEASILLAEGTVRSKVLESFGLNKTQKELVMIPVDSQDDEILHKKVAEKFALNQKNQGISFSIPFKRWTKDAQASKIGQEAYDYSLLMVVVEEGEHPSISAIARDHHARGGTVIHGRAQDIAANTPYLLTVSPQNDTVLIVVHNSIKDTVSKAILDYLESKSVGKLITLPVVNVTGIFKDSGGVQ